MRKTIQKGCLPIAKLGLIGWEKYDAGLSLVDISISILAILNNIEGQQLKDQLICEKGRCVTKNLWMLKCSR